MRISGMASDDPGSYGSFRLRDIAERAGVAPITVSRVINKPELVSEDTRNRVLGVIDDMGFVLNRLASSFSRAASRIVGTVAPPIINTGIAEQVQGMSDALSNSDYQLLVAPGELAGEHEERQVANMLGWQPAGLILQAFSESESMRTMLRARKLPIVEISEIVGQEPIDCVVGISNHEAARRMTLFLAECGYVHIAFMGASSHGNDRACQRIDGYRSAMAELRRPPVDVAGPLNTSYAANGLQELLTRMPDVEVIFCASDTFAIAAIQECRRRSIRVPEDLAITGFGDLDLASIIMPSLTTVRVDRYGMGRLAAETLLRRIAGDTSLPRVQNIGFEIIRRASA